jgi:hypothetical protein
LNQAWNKATKEVLAPNILAIIRRFNKVSSWVSYSIVRFENVQRRIWILERFILIAKVCNIVIKVSFLFFSTV